jgi:hypothetical protein
MSSMRARLAPMLYDETDREAAAAKRASIVAKAERSDAANSMAKSGRTRVKEHFGGPSSAS